MFSQTLTAQLLRMTLLLVAVLVGVKHCAPLLDALAEHAVSAGCHQHSQHHQEHHR